jgi:hypothetical protein
MTELIFIHGAGWADESSANRDTKEPKYRDKMKEDLAKAHLDPTSFELSVLSYVSPGRNSGPGHRLVEPTTKPRQTFLQASVEDCECCTRKPTNFSVKWGGKAANRLHVHDAIAARTLPHEVRTYLSHKTVWKLVETDRANAQTDQ